VKLYGFSPRNAERVVAARKRTVGYLNLLDATKSKTLNDYLNTWKKSSEEEREDLKKLRKTQRRKIGNMSIPTLLNHYPSDRGWRTDRQNDRLMAHREKIEEYLKEAKEKRLRTRKPPLN
jgi:hypothetical protein